ncbi:MAG: hypothetical protein IV107_25165, partial [Paucibacter sp.]|nr:hypothetical protein [Roseateles sp.]
MHIKLLSRLFLKTYLAAAMLLGLPSVYAWDGIVSGAIESIDITEGSNYGFRVILKNSPSMCSGGPNWAYLLDTDSNYKIFVAALLL